MRMSLILKVLTQIRLLLKLMVIIFCFDCYYIICIYANKLTSESIMLGSANTKISINDKYNLLYKDRYEEYLNKRVQNSCEKRMFEEYENKPKSIQID